MLVTDSPLPRPTLEHARAHSTDGIIQIRVGVHCGAPVGLGFRGALDDEPLNEVRVLGILPPGCMSQVIVSGACAPERPRRHRERGRTQTRLLVDPPDHGQRRLSTGLRF